MVETPDFSWLRLLLAFSVVLSLMGGLALALKYIGTKGFVLPTKTARTRRVKIVESLPIDARRRFMIVNCDGREHFLLLGAERDIVIETNLPPAPSPLSPSPQDL